MVVTETTVMGGGGSNEITMNPDEMHTIMRYIANIEISFRNIMRVERLEKQWTTMLICSIK